ncbi:uncharacterized protein LOC123275127 [Cotesia glomerata]|uniref:RING-type domain-containing protein n=1 Tax=Cotesia glomerata TaxID=32391 RepID=A0AAV7J5V7_COTGL|nr:uncharacterized protein LOC123275127 [Cotesia glomerata]XP_044598984.1 uncharacterized protein LOC123275127 [Cotesia glomerata]KAH0567127.1 hypothetical protein KQX54_006856 [Cotesia glomerata]
MNPFAAAALTACCLVVGAVAATIYAFSRRQYNNHHENHHNHQNEFNPGRARNLTCPFCGQAVVANDYPLACGHLCHVTCFRAQPASRRDNCSFCYDDQDYEVLDDQDDEAVVVRGSFSRMHEEVRYRPNHQSPSNINENDVTPASAPESTSGTASTTKEVCCAFCRVWLEISVDQKQLTCGHYAHNNCFEKLKHLVKCQECVSNDSSDSEDEI